MAGPAINPLRYRCQLKFFGDCAVREFLKGETVTKLAEVFPVSDFLKEELLNTRRLGLRTVCQELGILPLRTELILLGTMLTVEEIEMFAQYLEINSMVLYRIQKNVLDHAGWKVTRISVTTGRGHKFWVTTPNEDSFWVLSPIWHDKDEQEEWLVAWTVGYWRSLQWQ
jgi:hypothetical protein